MLSVVVESSKRIGHKARDAQAESREGLGKCVRVTKDESEREMCHKLERCKEVCMNTLIARVPKLRGQRILDRETRGISNAKAEPRNVVREGLSYLNNLSTRDSRSVEAMDSGEIL